MICLSIIAACRPWAYRPLPIRPPQDGATEPAVTNYTRGFKGCLDYIWWGGAADPDSARRGSGSGSGGSGSGGSGSGGGGGGAAGFGPVEALWPPSLSALEPFGGCPNLLLAATFEWL
eukprot:SAG22_NODE_3914_length_1469_cov_1.076642_2_plen_118_part_00